MLSSMIYDFIKILLDYMHRLLSFSGGYCLIATCAVRFCEHDILSRGIEIL